MSARLTVASLLSAWEDGWGRALSQRASSLLSAADPSVSAESLSELSIGARDRMLFAMRAEAFGHDMIGVATCPACLSIVELHFDSRSVPDPCALPATNGLETSCDGYDVRFRLPQAADLTAIHDASTVSSARALLLERCIHSVLCDGEAVGCNDLPPAVVEGVVKIMAAADPAAEIELDLTCSACSHHWVSPLDIAAFLWEEVSAWAARLLRDVHALALAYGWTEPEILSLSPRRRQIYLELCRG